jgi:hypothetical protein
MRQNYNICQKYSIFYTKTPAPKRSGFTPFEHILRNPRETSAASRPRAGSSKSWSGFNLLPGFAGISILVYDVCAGVAFAEFYVELLLLHQIYLIIV